MEPLIEELLELWDGVPAYDVNALLGSQHFNLRGVLLWTIHDYPGYGIVCGFAHQGFAACASCGSDLGVEHSTELGKQTYGGTRRWLPEGHRFRDTSLKDLFDGKVETRARPKVVVGEEQLQHAAEYETWKDMGHRERSAGDPPKVHGVKRVCIVNCLLYWQDLLIRYTVDLMHYEMNLAKKILKTLSGKKDTMKVRRDLQRRNIRPHLWLMQNPRRGGKMLKPAAPYILFDVEFKVFAETLENLKTPTSHSSNLGQHIRRKKFGGLKSHDYHVLMQQLMPLVLRGLLAPGPRMAVMRMCKVYRQICTKVYNPADFASLEVDVAESMALLEMEFPPSFFDVMTHLAYHLAKELDLCGPVSSRWMYPIERYMKTLKGYVTNMARPEASMAEGYLKDECVGFVTEYLQRFDTVQRRVWDAEEEYGDAEEVLEDAGKSYVMTAALRDLAHQYVLNNISVMQPFLRQWEYERGHNSSTISFEDWVRSATMRQNFDASDSNDMDQFLLCRKPSQKAIQHSRMKAFGSHFRTESSSTPCMRTYDCGVASIFQVPTANGHEVSVNYVGVLKDILKLDYGPVQTPIILLRCEWIKCHDNRGNNTYIHDEAGFLLLNTRHKLPRMSEPFIFPSQATQIFFSNIPNRPGWKVVLQKEVRSRREVLDTADVFITTTVEASGLTAPDEVPSPPLTASAVGAIELSTEENLLFCARF